MSIKPLPTTLTRRQALQQCKELEGDMYALKKFYDWEGHTEALEQAVRRGLELELACSAMLGAWGRSEFWYRAWCRALTINLALKEIQRRMEEEA